MRPIAYDDFLSVPKGTICGEAPVQKDGYFLSKMYFEEVCGAKNR